MTWILLAVLGLALAVLAAWLRLGRTDAARSWVGAPQLELTVLVTVPAVAVALLALAASHAGDAPLLRETGALVAGLALVVIIVFNAFRAPLPRWALPRWYVDRTAHRPGRRRGRVS